MKRFVLAALAVGAMAFGAPAAQATHTYEGGCGFDSITDPSEQIAQPDVFTGVAYGAVALTNPAGAPVDLTCEIRVNNVPKASFSAHGDAGIAAGAAQVQFLATDADTVTMCDIVTAAGHTSTVCGEATTTQIPPQEVIDLIDAIDQLIADTTEPTDAIVCSVLWLVAPALNDALYPTVKIDVVGDCDIYLDGERFIDFSPYNDTETPSWP